MASGSEVQTDRQAGKKLAARGINIRLVSFPSWELFAAQDEDYQKSVLPEDIERRISIEAGVRKGGSAGWVARVKFWR